MHNSHRLDGSSLFSEQAAPTQPTTCSNNDELRYWLALMLAPGVGTTRFLRTLQHTSDLPSLFAARGNNIIDLKLPTAVRASLQSPDWHTVDKILSSTDGN